MLCLCYLYAAEELLLEAEEWAAAAYLSLVIDRLRAANGLPERAPASADFDYGLAPCALPLGRPGPS
jgi:hypothetical protein